MVIAAFAAFLGHLFPVWLKFRGGKGVATYIGVLLGAAWPVGIFACLAWLATAAISRYSSLSALIAALLSPVFAWYYSGPPVAGLAADRTSVVKGNSGACRVAAGGRRS